MDSDYDFFTPTSQATRNWLESHGWHVVVTESYTDQNSDAVYRRGCVDVALVINLSLRVKVQELVKKLFPAFTSLPKSTQREVWRYSYALLGM